MDDDEDPALRRIRSIAETLRGVYFPKWDPRREWSFYVWPDNQFCASLCDRRTKNIHIGDYPAENDEFIAALICHEICHAIVDGNHTPRWARRMEKTADRAERLQNAELAGLLRGDVALEMSYLSLLWHRYFRPTLHEIAGRPEPADFDVALSEMLRLVRRNEPLLYFGWNTKTFNECYPQARAEFLAARAGIVGHRGEEATDFL